MSPSTRAIHGAIDDHVRRSGIPYLHPSEPTVQLDLLGSPEMAAWQDAKAAFLWTEEGCWSELPQVYARYGTRATAALITAVREIEHAKGVVLADCGMQAIGLLADATLGPGHEVVLCEQVYNKTRTLLDWSTRRLGGKLTVVPDGDLDAIAAAITPKTRLLFVETFTNPLMRAQDIAGLVKLTEAARAAAPELLLVVDDTVASPWGPRTPLLAQGVDVVVASGTKAMGGQDTDLWGYVASRRLPLLNQVMDMAALRGGTLDWRRATALLASLPRAAEDHAKRCASASRIASFLEAHPQVEQVFHPSLPSHPDHEIVEAQYARPGSLMSFRVKDADEAATRHLCDVLATCTVVRYALSFDGPTTKVNHHPTVSEYFTPPPVLRKRGLNRLVRLAVGLEDPDDVIAALNWTLWHARDISQGDLEDWRTARRAALGLG
jgi:cystathionine beta-lyase/cystathionine gamma-synthase